MTTGTTPAGLAQALRLYIESRGWTQKQAAEMAGLPPSTLNQYLSGARVPGWAQVVRFRDAWGFRLVLGPEGVSVEKATE